MKNNENPRRKRFIKRLVIIIAILAVIIIIINIVTPIFLVNYTNKKLTSLREYYGHVDDIDIHLLKGAYSINNIKLDMIDTTKNDTIPFFKSKSISIAIDWSVLFKGAVLASVMVENPEIKFTNKKAVKEKAKKTADTISIKQLISGYMPLTINKFEITGGQVKYIDQNVTPTLMLVLDNIHILAQNLSNVENKRELLPARLAATANMYEGEWNLQVRFNVLKRYPTFDMKMELNEINLVLLNDFLREYANFDVQSGKLSIFSEFAAKEGDFTGYVKPLIKDFQTRKWKEKEDFKEIVWEAIVGTAMKILKNDKTQRVATKIPVNGSFKNTDVDVWEAIMQVVTNAFISAIKPSFDNTINMSKVDESKKKKKEGFLKRIF